MDRTFLSCDVTDPGCGWAGSSHDVGVLRPKRESSNLASGRRCGLEGELVGGESNWEKCEGVVAEPVRQVLSGQHLCESPRPLSLRRLLVNLPDPLSFQVNSITVRSRTNKEMHLSKPQLP